MVTTSFQDWTRYTVPGANEAFEFVGVLPANYASPPIDMSPWSCLMFGFVNQDPTAYLQVIFNWSGFLTNGQGQFQRSIVVGPNQSGNFVLDNQDRTLAIFIVPIGVAPTQPFAYGIYGFNRHVSRYDVYRGSVTLVSDNSAYGSNVAKLFTAFGWYTGKAMVTASTDLGGPSAADLQYFDLASGLWQTYATVPVVSNRTGPPMHVFIPPAPFRAYVMNAGTAQNIEFYVVPELD